MGKLCVVCVDGRPGRAGESLAAVCHSAERVNASEAVLFGCEDPPGRPRSVRFLRIAPLGYCDYSAFMLYALGDLVRADHVLVVQADGWVVNAAAWSDGFLDYDYIGAPTHRAWSTGDAEWKSRFAWLPQAETARVVLNGGFSLRSRKLLRTPTEQKIPLHLPPFRVDGWPLRVSTPADEVNEDVQLCVQMRGALESAGLRFAPLDTAATFACEQLIPGLHDRLRPADIFGQHNRLRRLVCAAPPTVRYPLAETQLDGILREREMAEDLIRLGFRVEFVPDGPSR